MFEFKDFNYLTDGEIDIIIDEKIPENLDINYVPAYKCSIYLHNTKIRVGHIDIRIGYNENIRYGGNIGYEIIKMYRGHNYAAKACKLIKNIAIAHHMDKIFISCSPGNIASRKTCERAGLRLKEIIDLPTNNDMYQDGDRHKCIYEWILD